MNLLLLRGGYPPVAVRPEDRKLYLDLLEHASMRQNLRPFQTFMYERLDTTLGVSERLTRSATALKNRRALPSPPRPHFPDVTRCFQYSHPRLFAAAPAGLVSTLGRAPRSRSRYDTVPPSRIANSSTRAFMFKK